MAKPQRRALLVYPEFPPSYWGFRYALELIGKRASMPPLGLLTVAALFPEGWDLRLVDLNVRPLADDDLEWAELVLTSTMVVQQRSLREVVARCRAAGRPVVVGGPHPTSFADEIVGADHFLLDEVEEVFPRFLADWEAGVAGAVYRAEAKPALTVSPLPRFDLLDLSAYGSMAIQFSRGCPFDCEFCDITKLFGRVPRTKGNEQMLAELDRLHELGWRGSVFLVDDNFIGNRRDAMRLLPAVAEWQRKHGYPFDLFTEASVNLAQHDELMAAMVAAGFSMVFLGIESPNPEALQRTNKRQNTGRGEDDFLLAAVRRIQSEGLEVTGGFILGLDGDGPEVFDAQVDFVERAGIPIAMVGLLTALRGTNLHARLEREGRLLAESSGNNVEIALNFEPELEREVLVQGYRRVLSALYGAAGRSYFERCWSLLASLGPRPGRRRRPTGAEIRGFLRLLWLQAFSRSGPSLARFLARVLIRRPAQFGEAARMAVKGWHFRRYTEQTLAAHAFRAGALDAYDRMEALAESAAAGPRRLRAEARRYAARARRKLRRLHRRLRPEFLGHLLPDRAGIESALREMVRELAGLDLVRRWAPRFGTWFAGLDWRRALSGIGYSPTPAGRDLAAAPVVAIAPAFGSTRVRRALEHLFRELGVKLVSTREQLSLLGEEALGAIESAGDGVVSLREYLRAIGRRVDTLVVPRTGADGDPGAAVGFLTSDAAGLPRLISVGLEGSRRELRRRMAELGLALTGDPARAELACERACAFL